MNRHSQPTEYSFIQPIDIADQQNIPSFSQSTAHLREAPAGGVLRRQVGPNFAPGMRVLWDRWMAVPGRRGSGLGPGNGAWWRTSSAVQ
eukprot:1184610-Prorocentrum_minimum.AAC.3